MLLQSIHWYPAPVWLAVNVGPETETELSLSITSIVCVVVACAQPPDAAIKFVTV